MWLIATLILLAVAGTCYGLYRLQAEKNNRAGNPTAEMERLDALLDPEADPDAPWTQRLSIRLMALIRPLMPSVIVSGMRNRILQAGRPLGLTVEQFFAIKLALALTFPALIPMLVLFRVGSSTMLVMGAAAVLGWILPDVWLNGQVADRRRQTQRELPLFADLIATSLEAGLSLTEAVRRVATDAPGLVAAEFLRTVQEMAAGKPRAQAWRDLTDRVPGDDFRTIVGAIMQAEQYGTSVADILRYQVSQIRLLKQQQAQRMAQAATVRMRVPMLLFILLPFMALLLGPAMLQLAKLLL